MGSQESDERPRDDCRKSEATAIWTSLKCHVLGTVQEASCGG